MLIHQLGLLGVAAGALELAGELLAGLAFLGAAQDRAGLSIEWGQGGEASGQEQQDWDGAQGGHRQGWAGSSRGCHIPPPPDQPVRSWLESQGSRQIVNICLIAGGWLLGLFWCHQRPDGPPWGSDPALLAQQLTAAGFRQELWEPAQGSAPERDNEWLGLWRKSSGPEP